MPKIRNKRRVNSRKGRSVLSGLLVTAVLVLGPLAIVAYACGGGGSASSSNWGGGWGGWGGGGSGSGAQQGGSGNSGGGSSGGGQNTGGQNTGGQGSGGQGSGSQGPGGQGSGSQGSGSTGQPSAEGGAGNNGVGGSGSQQAPAQSQPSAGNTGSTKPAAPSGGVVTENKGKGGSHKGSGRGSSGGKSTGKSSGGKSGSKSSGSRSTGNGSPTSTAAPARSVASVGAGAIAGVSASARPLSAAITPLIRTHGDPSGASAHAQAGERRAQREASQLRERTTIARAVDGIPLVFRTALLALIFATSLLAVVSLRERRRASAAARVAQLDHLTGLANREGFDRQMAIEWSRALRHGRPLGLVFVDLDRFKAFNDTHGHVAGDRLLREVAAAITATARTSDFTARLGGDEFVVLCPDTDAAGLDRLVERLRVEAAGMAVTISVGAASRRADDAASDELVKRADAAMYAAKEGRHRGVRSTNPMLGSLRRS